MDTLSRASLLHRLKLWNACDDSLHWLAQEPGAPPATVWATCGRGDWLLWLAGVAGVRRQDLVLAACACARLGLPLIPEDEDRPLHAIMAAEEWARGDLDVSPSMVARLRYDALGVCLFSPDAACASGAAAEVVGASPGLHVASAACEAASFVARAVAIGTAGDRPKKKRIEAATLRECAALVRERIAWAEVEAGILGSAGRQATGDEAEMEILRSVERAKADRAGS